MNIKKRYKVLKNPYHKRDLSLMLGKERYEKVNVYSNDIKIFNRPGFYFDRQLGKVWIETENGDVIEETVDLFKHNLRLLNAEELSPEQIKGLNYICQTNLATKEQRRLGRDFTHYFLLKNMTKSSKLWFHKARRKNDKCI